MPGGGGTLERKCYFCPRTVGITIIYEGSPSLSWPCTRLWPIKETNELLISLLIYTSIVNRIKKSAVEWTGLNHFCWWGCLALNWWKDWFWSGRLRLVPGGGPSALSTFSIERVFLSLGAWGIPEEESKRDQYDGSTWVTIRVYPLT